MYGRLDAVAPSRDHRRRGERSGAGGSNTSHRVLPPGFKPGTVAAARELTTKSVAELLAASSHQHHDNSTDTLEERPVRTRISRLSDDSEDEFREDRYQHMRSGREHRDNYDDAGRSTVCLVWKKISRLM